jgi:hypothetical protein
VSLKRTYQNIRAQAWVAGQFRLWTKQKMPGPVKLDRPLQEQPVRWRKACVKLTRHPSLVDVDSSELVKIISALARFFIDAGGAME